jgi:hypothetical protein
LPLQVPEQVNNGEQMVAYYRKAAYKTFRDSAIFTSKRLTVRDAQGFSGKKVEIYSLPYSLIFMWSSENGHGIFNVNSEIELWTKAGHIWSIDGSGLAGSAPRTWRKDETSLGCLKCSNVAGAA